jgi:glycosyltransferase involved in cell wall biosynthesis
MILHIDTDDEWRGGQQQAVYLIEGLLSKGIKNIFCCQKDSLLEKYFKKNNIEYFTLPLKSELDIYSAIRLAIFVKKNKVKIVHCHNSHALSIAIMMKYFINVPLFASRRVDFKLKNNIFSKFKYSTSKLDRLVCISDNIRKVVENCGISANKLITIRSAINLAKVGIINEDNVARIRHNEYKGNFVFGTVAAHTGHKDYPTFIKAAKLVIDRYPEILFYAIGSGKLTEQLSQQINSLGLSKNFILAGFKSNVYDYLSSFDVFVISSKLEGLGTSVLDAMNCSLPIIGTNAGGIPEMLINERNGLIVDKKKPELLANAIIRMYEDKDLRMKLAKQAYQDVKKFAIPELVSKHIKLYKEYVDEL